MYLHCFLTFFFSLVTALTLRNSISRTNFRLLVALFGPLNLCAAKCRELIEAGIFHGEITSQEADERLKAVNVVGAYLVRLRKGSRHQVALAFTDSQKAVKHILLDVKDGAYCIHQLTTMFSVCFFLFYTQIVMMFHFCFLQNRQFRNWFSLTGVSSFREFLSH